MSEPRLLPRVATEAMLQAAFEAMGQPSDGGLGQEGYEALWNAAPQGDAQPVVWGWHWLERVVGGKWDGEELNSGLSMGPRKPEFKSSSKTLVTEHLYTALYTSPKVAP